METMDEFEIQARVFGNPAPVSDIVVFDRKKLAVLKDKVTAPTLGQLTFVNTVVGDLEIENQLVNLMYSRDLEFSAVTDGPLRVWEKPQVGAKYLLAVDTAAGLSMGNKKYKPDYSCATVFKWVPEKLKNGITKLEMVAQWHGWINLSDYATEIKKLGV
jgi:hypothetical protein